MNSYLQKAIWLAVGVISLLAPSLSHAAGKKAQLKDSSSSSESCSTKRKPKMSKIKAPPYIVIEDDKPVMNIAVINRSNNISEELLEKTLTVVRQQVYEDFAPFYGIYVKFSTPDNEEDVNWRYNVPLIIDDFLPESAGCNFISFHALQTDNHNGFPIDEAVFNPPSVPHGTPYIVVAVGDESTCYGITPVLNEGLPFFPQTFDGFFSQAVSHEVLETLHNYTTNLATLDFSEEGFGSETILTFFHEICEPVAFSRGYKICGLNVANFVLPSFWVNDLCKGPFDFLKTTHSRFLPHGGQQEVLLTYPCGTAAITIISPPPCVADPEDFFIDGYPLFSCNEALVNTIPAFLKGKKNQKPIVLQNASKTKPGMRAYKPYQFPVQQAAKKAA